MTEVENDELVEAWLAATKENARWNARAYNHHRRQNPKMNSLARRLASVALGTRIFGENLWYWFGPTVNVAIIPAIIAKVSISRLVWLAKWVTIGLGVNLTAKLVAPKWRKAFLNKAVKYWRLSIYWGKDDLTLSRIYNAPYQPFGLRPLILWSGSKIDHILSHLAPKCIRNGWQACKEAAQAMQLYLRNFAEVGTSLLRSIAMQLHLRDLTKGGTSLLLAIYQRVVPGTLKRRLATIGEQKKSGGAPTEPLPGHTALLEALIGLSVGRLSVFVAAVAGKIWHTEIASEPDNQQYKHVVVPVVLAAGQIALVTPTLGYKTVLQKSLFWRSYFYCFETGVKKRKARLQKEREDPEHKPWAQRNAQSRPIVSSLVARAEPFVACAEALLRNKLFTRVKICEPVAKETHALIRHLTEPFLVAAAAKQRIKQLASREYAEPTRHDDLHSAWLLVATL